MNHVLFYDVHKENMFTINLGDGREAPWISSIYKSDDMNHRGSLEIMSTIPLLMFDLKVQTV